MLLMHTFTTFTEGVELFKSRKGHRTLLSVYLVAKRHVISVEIESLKTIHQIYSQL